MDRGEEEVAVAVTPYSSGENLLRLGQGRVQEVNPTPAITPLPVPSLIPYHYPMTTGQSLSISRHHKSDETLS